MACVRMRRPPTPKMIATPRVEKEVAPEPGGAFIFWLLHNWWEAVSLGLDKDVPFSTFDGPVAYSTK